MFVYVCGTFIMHECTFMSVRLHINLSIDAFTPYEYIKIHYCYKKF